MDFILHFKGSATLRRDQEGYWTRGTAVVRIELKALASRN
jgi:hypothetical protein